MPRYDYHCPECGRTFEAWRGVEDNSAPCPTCGADAKRAFCSGLPAIKGETIGKAYDTSGAITKHGYVDLDMFQEAHEDMLRDSAKRGVEPPDVLGIAKERVATGRAGPSRLAK